MSENREERPGTNPRLTLMALVLPLFELLLLVLHLLLLFLWLNNPACDV